MLLTSTVVYIQLNNTIFTRISFFTSVIRLAINHSISLMKGKDKGHPITSHKGPKGE
jgi:hypothetical protein